MTEERQRRIVARRNRGEFLLGASWSHHSTWECRRTHVYVGFWVLTIFTYYDGGD